MLSGDYVQFVDNKCSDLFQIVNFISSEMCMIKHVSTQQLRIVRSSLLTLSGVFQALNEHEWFVVFHCRLANLSEQFKRDLNRNVFQIDCKRSTVSNQSSLKRMEISSIDAFLNSCLVSRVSTSIFDIYVQRQSASLFKTFRTIRIRQTILPKRNNGLDKLRSAICAIVSRLL